MDELSLNIFGLFETPFSFCHNAKYCVLTYIGLFGRIGGIAGRNDVGIAILNDMQLPGNKTHQKILQLLIDLFQTDKNIEAFIVFGSLIRGNWDDYSDLDLDAVITNDSREIVQNEIKQMLDILSSSGFKILTAFEEFPNEQVIILDSLDRISIRFHLLKNTNNSILDSMQILCGKLTKEHIQKSCVKKEKNPSLELLNNKFLELAIYVPISLTRNKPMNALFFINKMRQTIIQIYNYSHGIEREFDFESKADIALINNLKETYGNCAMGEINQAFNSLLDLYEHKIRKMSADKLSLSDDQLKILRKVKDY